MLSLSGVSQIQSFIISVPILIRVSSETRSNWLPDGNLNSLNLEKTPRVQVKFTHFLFCWFHTGLSNIKENINTPLCLCDFYFENKTPPGRQQLIIWHHHGVMFERGNLKELRWRWANSLCGLQGWKRVYLFLSPAEGVCHTVGVLHLVTYLP